jgi:hypothetical protein
MLWLLYHAAAITILGLTQLSHSASQRRVFACGSMVHYDRMFVGFLLGGGAQKQKTKKKKYRSAEGKEAPTA